MDRKEVAKCLVKLAKQLMSDWPSSVESGALRKKMGLDPEKSLEEQASPSKVAEFFKKTDAEGRGMVMFAVNSNQDVDFWKKVGQMIKKK